MNLLKRKAVQLKQSMVKRDTLTSQEGNEINLPTSRPHRISDSPSSYPQNLLRLRGGDDGPERHDGEADDGDGDGDACMLWMQMAARVVAVVVVEEEEEEGEGGMRGVWGGIELLRIWEVGRDGEGIELGMGDGDV